MIEKILNSEDTLRALGEEAARLSRDNFDSLKFIKNHQDLYEKVTLGALID